jgi:hypothetical protein
VQYASPAAVASLRAGPTWADRAGRSAEALLAKGRADAVHDGPGLGPQRPRVPVAVGGGGGGAGGGGGRWRGEDAMGVEDVDHVAQRRRNAPAAGRAVGCKGSDRE